MAVDYGYGKSWQQPQGYRPLGDVYGPGNVRGGTVSGPRGNWLLGFGQGGPLWRAGPSGGWQGSGFNFQGPINQQGYHTNIFGQPYGQPAFPEAGATLYQPPAPPPGMVKGGDFRGPAMRNTPAPPPPAPTVGPANATVPRDIYGQPLTDPADIAAFQNWDEHRRAVGYRSFAPGTYNGGMGTPTRINTPDPAANMRYLENLVRANGRTVGKR